MAWERVYNTKKELGTAKGEKLVDYYNLLAECYFWIWDENDKHFDTACMYKDKAYELAKKLNYKKGIAYSKESLHDRQLMQWDKDRNNNDKEAAYIQTYKKAEEALKLADELKDHYLSGIIYHGLAWKEKWWGDRGKFKAATLKGIQHIEKVTGNEFKDIKPLFWINCSGCKGTEALLAHFYQDLATIYVQENNPAAKEKIELAINYYNKVKTINRPGFLNYPLAAMYQTFGQIYFLKYDYKKALEAYIKSKESFHEDFSIELELTALNEMSKVYEATSDFENGIQNFKNSIKLIEDYFKNKPAGSAKRNSAGQAYFWMSRIYKIAGDYEGALDVMHRGRQYYPSNDTATKAPWMSEIGDSYRLLGKYDSSMHYLKGFQNSDNSPNNFGKISLGYLYLDTKEYSTAQSLILPFYQNLKTINRISNPIVNALNILGNASLAEKKYEQALKYANEAQGYLKQMEVRVLMIDNFKLLSDIFNKMNKHDSAYSYLKQYTRLKDSLINRQFYFKLNSLKSESEEQKKTSMIQLLQKDNLLKQQQLQQQILIQQQNKTQLALLNKNNEIKGQQILLKDQTLLIKDQELQLKDRTLKEQQLLRQQKDASLALLDKDNKLKDQQLKKQAFIRNALLTGLFLLLLLGILIFRGLALKRRNERLQNEKKQAELQQQSSELEMQALRAQMNPHFIFNCLSSINKFILKSESRAASDYLTRFSRLIRMVLTNSQLSMIPLSDEIEMLRLYLDMERLRFSDSFDYNIVYANTIEPETIYIPPMLLQPFCENAIWHGLMHNDVQGKLDIVMSLQNGQLQCIISDNGIGRAKASELKSKSGEKQKSFGLKITTERLALFNNENTVRTFYNIEDILDKEGNVEGTEVTLLIKHKDDVKQSLVKAI
jgi:hypothetical protein